MNVEGFLYQLVGQLGIEDVFALLAHGLDEVAAVIPLSAIDERGHDMRAEPLAIADDGRLRLGAQVVDEENAIVYGAQLLEQLVERQEQGGSFLTVGDNGVDHVVMSLQHGLELVFPCLVALKGQLGCGYQLVGDASQCAHHNDHLFFFSLYNLLQAQNAFYGTYGCSAKFHYFHFLVV